jgi:hypothetical protein
LNKKSTEKKRFTGLVLLLSWLAAPLLAAAQETADSHPILADKYFLSAGIYFPERSFKISVDASVPSLERQIDISEQFKLKSSETTEAFEFGWRFGEKWLLRGQYFSVGGSRSATLEEDVVWGDYTFGAGTGIYGGIDVAITRLYVGRTFRKDNIQEFGIGGGMHLLDLSAFIGGTAIINNDPPVFTERRASTTGPLPNLGGWYIRSLSKKLALNVRLDWLSADIDKYDGTIINAALGLNYALAEHFGVGVSYNHFELDIGITDDNWKGSAEQRINGPFLYLTANW